MKSNKPVSKGKEGKKFEEDVAKSMPTNMYHERYKDSPTQYKKVDNPADRFVFTGKYMFLIECKSTKEDRLPLANVRMNQVWKMLEATTKLNTFGGILINFRSKDETYFIPITDFVYWMITNRQTKSMNYELVKSMSYRVSQRKKISRWSYGILGLIKWVEDLKYVNESERDTGTQDNN